jgi:hypothetical protein
MALNGPGIDVTFKAGANLSTHQYKVVYLSAANTVTILSAATDLGIGILQNAPTSGQDAVVRIIGISKCITGGDVTRGGLFGSANGTAVANTLGTNTDKPIYGQVLESVTSGSTTTVKLFGGPTQFETIPA